MKRSRFILIFAVLLAGATGALGQAVGYGDAWKLGDFGTTNWVPTNATTTTCLGSTVEVAWPYRFIALQLYFKNNLTQTVDNVTATLATSLDTTNWDTRALRTIVAPANSQTMVQVTTNYEVGSLRYWKLYSLNNASANLSEYDATNGTTNAVKGTGFITNVGVRYMLR